MMVLGIAWIAFFYVVVRAEAGAEPGGPAYLGDLGDWNYVIGFGLLLLGLGASAHPKTPLGRGRGVVVGMLTCFLVGLIWICTYYVISDDVSRVPVMDDLGQWNLVVGISFMAVGFTFATRWE
ncbi:cell division protein CrgA [Nocardioides coralli]|nr:cell division protein CrgA [Nocardioides coralli]